MRTLVLRAVRIGQVTRWAPLAALVFLFAAANCGGAAAGGSSDRYLITAQDLAPYPSLNLYEAIRHLRRFWLSGSGGRPPSVFVEGVEVGDAMSLERYPADTVAEVRFIQPNAAMGQLGASYSGGVIRVTLR